MDADLGGIVIGVLVATAVLLGVLAPVMRKMNAVAQSDMRERVLTAEQILRSGKAPVLYLRPFDVDGSKSADWKVFSMLGFGAPTVEAEMVALLREHGPVVAIGFPGETQPGDIGAARAQCPHDGWQDFVLDWMARARLIVVVAGVSKGVEWELRNIGERGYLAKTIFVLSRSVAAPRVLASLLEQHAGAAAAGIDALVQGDCVVRLAAGSAPVVVAEPGGVLTSGRVQALRIVLDGWRHSEAAG